MKETVDANESESSSAYIFGSSSASSEESVRDDTLTLTPHTNTRDCFMMH